MKTNPFLLLIWLSLEFFLGSLAMGNNPQEWVPVYQRKGLQPLPKEKDPVASGVASAPKVPQAPVIEEAEVKALRQSYKQDYKDKKDLISLKQKTLKLSGKAVPVLI